MTFKKWISNPTGATHYYTGWEEDDLSKLKKLKSLKDPIQIMRQALFVGVEIVDRLPFELGIVCGPISTGEHSVQKNLEIFDKTVMKISDQMHIFNQMPFEPTFAVAHNFIKDDEVLCPNNMSSKFFIDRFYNHIFASGKKWKPHFISGWEHSVGATIEHEIFTGLKSEITYLPKDFVL